MLRKVAIGGIGGAVGLLLLWPLIAAAQTGTSRQQLIASGDDSILWIVFGEWSGAEKDRTFINWLSYLDKSSTQIHPLIGIHSPKGRIIRSTVVGDSLHVFFSEKGDHYRYTRKGARRELRLPGQALPEAIAGDTNEKQPRLWAVVKDDTAQRVAVAWASSSLRTTQPSSESAVPTTQTQPTLVSSNPNSLHLVQYNGAEWEPGFAATPLATGSERVWLCVSGDRFHLFWQKSKQDANVNYAWYEKGQWTAGPAISFSQPPQDATANFINRQLVFISLLPIHDESQQLRCVSWLRQAHTNETGESASWNELPIPKTKDGKPMTLPMGSAVAAFADNNLVALRMGDGLPEVGIWALTSGGPPEQAFRPVPIRKSGGESETPRGVREFVTTLIVAMILLLVFWRRQGNFSLAVALPGEFMIARPGKRALAALIDLAPALIVVCFWWWAPLNEFYEEANRAPEQIEALPPELFWSGVWFRIIYTAYCLCFEMFTSRTPGKWLMGCVVWSESLARPTPLQIIIRNLMRLVEFEPLLLIWPFMLVIFFTRDRQRIGDLLARTIVVERNTHIIDLSERKPEE